MAQWETAATNLPPLFTVRGIWTHGSDIYVSGTQFAPAALEAEDAEALRASRVLVVYRSVDTRSWSPTLRRPGVLVDTQQRGAWVWVVERGTRALVLNVSSDGGRTWRTAELPPTVERFVAGSERTVFVVEGATVRRSRNGGLDWSDPLAVASIGPAHADGQGGLWFGRGSTLVHLGPEASAAHAVASLPDGTRLHRLAVDGTGRGWIVGQAHHVVRTYRLETTMELRALAPELPLHPGEIVLGRRHAFLEAADVSRTPPATYLLSIALDGSQWERERPPHNQTFELRFVDPDDAVWADGGSGQLVRRTP